MHGLLRCGVSYPSIKIENQDRGVNEAMMPEARFSLLENKILNNKK
jgi:hypothetical protein